jgi:hypothetical protein
MRKKNVADGFLSVVVGTVVLAGVGILGYVAEKRGLLNEVAQKSSAIEACSRKNNKAEAVNPYWYRKHGFSDSNFNLIKRTAERVGVDSDLLLAIRKAENGGEGLEFGVIPNDRYLKDNGYFVDGKFIDYENSLEKQAAWCAWTIRKNKERWPREENFIDFLGDRYSPIGAKDDPDNLNENWKGNVRYFYEKFKQKD